MGPASCLGGGRDPAWGLVRACLGWVRLDLERGDPGFEVRYADSDQVEDAGWAVALLRPRMMCLWALHGNQVERDRRPGPEGGTGPRTR
jgi:hypothetical protein